MITAKRLKAVLAQVPDDAKLWGYSGLTFTSEDTGIGIQMPDGTHAWIRARETDEDDAHTENIPGVSE